jgi:glycosyltransferase involved in cell wall biosynthesis
VVGVAGGVADTLARCTLLSRKAIAVAYNPVVTDDIFTKAAAPVSHPFLGAGIPVVLGIGKLSPQKDFTTFLEAIALANGKQNLRAIILGEGIERQMLEARRTALGLDGIVDLPGFATNPYGYIAATNLFVLSSRWEGLPTVVIEALALGANIVSTDCPSGPREILGDDRFGRLVPVGDAAALADAILAALAAPKDADAARARGQDFTLAAALDAYGKVIAGLPA